MSDARRGHRNRRGVAGYVSGSDAPLEATSTALANATSARSVVLVEGISDQIALETLAARQGRDLVNEGVVIVPIGGAQAIGRYLARFGPQGADIAIVGLCDRAEETYFERALAAAGLGSPRSRADMEESGFFVCVDDLEDELIRASGRASIEAILDTEGDLASFRTLQTQPGWRDADFESQMRRYLGAGARRKLRYASLLVGSLDLDRVPRPLDLVLARGDAHWL